MGESDTKVMKHLITLLTLGTAVFLAAPTAEARGHYRSSRTYVEYHRSCRGPAYIERYVAYYDCHGHPVWRVRVIPVHRHHHHGPSISVQWGRSCR
jgi:hypothetical protein